MRPEEERRGLTLRRPLAVGDMAWSEGNDGGGQCPGVVVGSSRRRVVVLGGAVLGVWSTRSERGQSSDLWQLSSSGYGGDRSGEKGAPWWGWLPLSPPEVVDDGGVAAGIGGWGNGGSDAVGEARQKRPLSEGGRRGPDAVGPWFRPSG
jgi:hypothetical protein